MNVSVTCFRCQQKGHYANDCKNEEVAKKVTTILNTFQRVVEMDQNFDISKLSTWVLEKKGKFDEKFVLTNPHKKLIYLDSKVESTEVAMLIDTRANKSFMSPRCDEKLALAEALTKEV